MPGEKLEDINSGIPVSCLLNRRNAGSPRDGMDSARRGITIGAGMLLLELSVRMTLLSVLVGMYGRFGELESTRDGSLIK